MSGAGGRLLDISPRVSARIGVWPGDVPFRRIEALRLADGANIDLSSVTTTLHVGAHVDAPSHYVAAGASIDRRPLDLYFGPCQVISVALPRGARIRPADFDAPVKAPRILFHTGSYPDPEVFTTDFNSLSPELVAYLATREVRLIGLDTPSVDPFDDRALEAHHALDRHDMANLEGIVLDQVPDGLYTLIALPLAIEGADASPVRAALVRIDD